MAMVGEAEVGLIVISVVGSVDSVVGEAVVCMAAVVTNIVGEAVVDVAVLVGNAVGSIISSCVYQSFGSWLICGLTEGLNVGHIVFAV